MCQFLCSQVACLLANDPGSNSMIPFAMTRTQAQIIELFQTLPVGERRELAEQLYERAVRSSFFDTMSAEQRAQLDRSIAEADRDEGDPVDIVFDRLASKLGIARSP